MSDPTWQYHDPPDNQTSSPAQRPRGTAQRAKYSQSNLTGPHRSGQPYACRAGHIHRKDRTALQGDDPAH